MSSIYFPRKVIDNVTLTFLPNLNIPSMRFTEYEYALPIITITKTSLHIPAPETRTSCNGKLPDPGIGKVTQFLRSWLHYEAEDSMLRAMPPFSESC